MILNRAKDYYENDKERLREQTRDKYRNLSEEEKTKRENMEKAAIIICLRKKSKDYKNTKKDTVRLKSLNIIINKTSFDSACCDLCKLNILTEIKVSLCMINTHY